MTRNGVFVAQCTRALLLLASIGCGQPAPSPAETVDQYFRFLARDPIRTLPLLSAAFHVEHGLHVGTTSEALRHLRGESASSPSLPPSGGTGDEAASAAAPDRLALAWLGVQMREPFRVLRDRISVIVRDVQENGDRAVVTVRVRGGAGRSFEQRFDLVRAAPGGPWRIDGIEQSDVADEDLALAFVAHPTEAARIRLENKLRRGSEAAQPAP